MKFGLFTTLEHTTGDPRREYEEFLHEARRAEDLGFDSIWLAEHHGSEYGMMPRPAIMAATIAAQTNRIRIGSLVTNLPFEYPVRIAEDWAMVDVISGGRLDLGVGRGYQPAEFAMMGMDPSTSREVFEESLEVLLGLWAGEPFSYQGKHFQLDNVQIFPKPLQGPRPPIWVGALSPESFALVAKHGLNIATQPTLMPMPMLKDATVQAARLLIENGRSPESIDFPLQMMTHIAPTKAQARAEAEPALNWFFDRVLSKVPGATGKAAASYEFYKLVADQMSGAISMEMLEETGIVLVTDPDGAVEALQQHRRDIGTKQFSAWMRFGGMPQDQVLASMDLFAKEVMPELADDSSVPDAFVSAEAPSFAGA